MIKKYLKIIKSLCSKKVVLIGILLFVIILLSPLNIKTILTSISNKYKEGTEVELDNWEISTVFYDSTVNEGRTPLTEIDWDASDGGYKSGEERVITVQINYKNTNTVTNYEPGELNISLENLGYYIVNNNNSYLISNNIVVGANDSLHDGFDWNIINPNNNKYNTMEKLVFSNDKNIESNINFEGSIQVLYTLMPKADNPVHLNENSEFVPTDSCIKSFNKKIKTTLNDELNSNEITFNYERTYNHPWKRRSYTLQKQANRISSLDGLPSGDYYWVKYNLKIWGYSNNNYPEYGSYNHHIIDEIPDNCIVYDGNLNKITPINGKYIIEQKSWSNNTVTNSIYVGYPKSDYNDNNNNLVITNKAQLYSKFPGSNDYEYTDEDEVSLNLSDYDFSYSGDLYSVSKSKYVPEWWDAIYHYKQSLTGEYNPLGSKGNQQWYLFASTMYTGNEYDLKIGDDLLFITRNNGNIEKLQDDEYYFSRLSFPSTIYNGNNIKIDNEKYDCELWIKYSEEDEYIKYEEFKNKSKSWTFTEEQRVVGFYFIINNLKESIVINNKSYSISATTTINSAKNISDTGKIYNSNYIEVYSNEELLNNVTSSSYKSLLTELNVPENDLNQYNHYMMRGMEEVSYLYYENPQLINRIQLSKRMTQFSQNDNKKIFTGNAVLSSYFLPHDSPGHGYQRGISSEGYLYFSGDTLNYDEGFTGYEIFDLLPEGMELSSSKEEILSSLSISAYPMVVDIDKKQISFNEFKNLIINNSTIEITNNWKNTNRTSIKIEVDLHDTPIYILNFSYGAYHSILYINYDYDYKVSYDSYIEYGKKWDNDFYYYYKGNQFGNSTIDSSDFDQDGDISERYIRASASATINSAVSTHQDVQVLVQSDKSNYSTGTVSTSSDSEYLYKLRARTGTNDVTNLVIYDSLEKYTKDPNMENILSSGGRKSWQGEFLGIDTSYAESKGYTVKTYYSENEEVGSIKTDDSWQIYNDSVDKTKVKSLAFEYLDSEGNPAVIPSNSLTYVLIRMKSPSDENIKSFAYNGCWTEWNAIDSLTGNVVDFITGINSNIVKVSLPNSVEPVDIDLNIDKYWNDNNNELGIRPNTINIKLIPDEDITKAIIVPLGNTNIDNNNSNHWSTSITVPKYDDDGNIIDYTLREDEIILDNGYKYTPTIDNNTITNVLMKEIELKKIWKDNTNSYQTRPGNVTYTIKQNNNNYKEVTFTGDYSTNEWTKIITVPVYNTNNKYNYTIEETNIENYSSNCSEFTCTNVLSGNKNISITKEWNDNNNSYNTRPDSIKVNLLRNNTLFREITITSNNWKSDNIEVPIYDEDGVKYIYTINEENIDEYGLVEYNQDDLNIVNTLKKKINLVITKRWIDDNNSNNTRPNELTITLLRNNEEYKNITLTGDTNEWTTTIEVDKYDDNQNKYIYTIKEINDSIKDEYSNVEYSEDELTVTNKLSKNTTLTISKKWIDQDNMYYTRPDSININLLQNGNLYRKLIISKNNNWQEIVEDIPVYDENGVKYTYTIEENNIDKKYGKIIYDQTKLEVTNELTELPTVSLYFTLINGYIDPVTGEMKYDDFGLNEILTKYNINPNDEYIFKLELLNTDTGKKYEGKLTTKGILEFKDIPYGNYKVVEGEDKLFQLVDILSIEEVNGVSFRKEGNEGYITIKPTGENISFGVKLINKIDIPINNPKTSNSLKTIIKITIVIISIISYLYITKKKKLHIIK